MTMKKYLHIVFLVTVIVLKVASASLHIYLDHNDADTSGEKCELCEHAIHNQDLDSDIPDEFASVEVIFSNFAFPQNLYISVHKKFTINSYRFGRPPPSLV